MQIPALGLDVRGSRLVVSQVSEARPGAVGVASLVTFNHCTIVTYFGIRTDCKRADFAILLTR